MLRQHSLPWFSAIAMRSVGNLLSPGGRRARLTILIYHRVLTHPDPLLSDEYDKESFAWQVRLLAEHFNVLGLTEAIERMNRGSLPSRAVCLTFDDGYLDNVENALPILMKHKVRATFFISSGFLDGSCMWNDVLIETVRQAEGQLLDLTGCGLEIYPIATPEERGQAVQSLLNAIKYLEPAERQRKIDQILAQSGATRSRDLMVRPDHIRRLAQAGMEIGGHTVTHPILTRITPQAARSEIADGKEALEGIIREPVRLFAYPNGVPGRDYSDEHVKMVKDLGFKAAVSTAPGAATTLSQPYQLPRFDSWASTPTRFTLHLLQNYTRTSSDVV